MLKKKILTFFLFCVTGLSAFSEEVYFDAPEGFHKQIEVAGCFYEHEGKVLFLLRNPNKPQGNTWGIPGGKIDKGETPREAVVREFYEETGITLDAKHLEYSGKAYITSPDKDFVFHVFKAEAEGLPENVTLAPLEHTQYEWLSLQEALGKHLIPGEEECIQYFYPEMRDA